MRMLLPAVEVQSSPVGKENTGTTIVSFPPENVAKEGAGATEARHWMVNLSFCSLTFFGRVVRMVRD